MAGAKAFLIIHLLTLLGILPYHLGMKQEQEKQLWVRMPLALAKRVEAMAQAEDRTLSSMLRVLITEALDNREQKGGRK